MIKFLFTTDWHLVSKNPRYRKDDVLVSQFRKVKQIFEIYKKEQCSFMIHGGDLFDTASPSFLVLNHLAKGIRTFNKRDNGCIYFVPGSHDLIGYNVSSIKQTAVGSLVNSGLINILDKIEIDGFEVIGMPASLTLTEDGFRYDNKVLVCHNAVSDVPLPYEYIAISSITRKASDCLVLSGHIHKRIYVVDSSSNIFVNPGPIVRTSIEEKDLIPSVAVIIIDKGSVKVEFKELEYSKDVFDVENYVVDKESEMKFDTFLNQLKEYNIDCTQSLESLIREHGPKFGISEEVMLECLRRITGG